MKDIKIPMTWEEFENHKIPLGWKAEYFDGYAYITPRHHGIMVKIKVEKREIQSNAELNWFRKLQMKNYQSSFTHHL